MWACTQPTYELMSAVILTAHLVTCLYVYHRWQIPLQHDYMTQLFQPQAVITTTLLCFYLVSAKVQLRGVRRAYRHTWNSVSHRTSRACEFSATDAAHMVPMKKTFKTKPHGDVTMWVLSCTNTYVLVWCRSGLSSCYHSCVICHKHHQYIGCLAHPYCRGLQHDKSGALGWKSRFLEGICCRFQLWLLPDNNKFTTREQRKPTCQLYVMGTMWV